MRGHLIFAAGIGIAIFLLNLIPPEYGYRAGVWTREMLADHAACLITAAAVAAVSFIAGVRAACAKLRG